MFSINAEMDIVSLERVRYLDFFFSFSGQSMVFSTFRVPVRICRCRGTGNASVGVGQAVCFFLFVMVKSVLYYKTVLLCRLRVAALRIDKNTIRE